MRGPPRPLPTYRRPSPAGLADRPTVVCCPDNLVYYRSRLELPLSGGRRLDTLNPPIPR